MTHDTIDVTAVQFIVMIREQELSTTYIRMIELQCDSNQYETDHSLALACNSCLSSLLDALGVCEIERL